MNENEENASNEVKEATTANQKVKKKGCNKKVVITIIVLILLAAISVGGYFIYQALVGNASFKDKWAEKYYEYILENKSDSEKIQNKSKIGFINIKQEETPIMVSEYTKSDDNYIDLYYVIDGKIQQIKEILASKVVYLYNIGLEEYSWYLKTDSKENNECTYTPVLDIVLENKYENGLTEDYDGVSSFTFSNDDKISATVDGETLSISQKDVVFVETGIELTTVDINNDMSDKQIKKALVKSSNEYKSEDNLLTDSQKNDISAKATELEELIEKIETALEAEMEVTQDNFMDKIGEQLKYFTACYRGGLYGPYELFSLEGVDIEVPGIDPINEMAYEVKGLTSIEALRESISKNLSSDVIDELNSRPYTGDITKFLHDYNGKVYFGIGGIGDGSYIKYEDAKVISSEYGTTIVELTERNAFTDDPETSIKVTLSYEYDISDYIVVDYTTTQLY